MLRIWYGGRPCRRHSKVPGRWLLDQIPRMVIFSFSGLSKRILCINSLRPRRNGRYNADDILKCIFLNENVSIAIKISLKFVPKGPINNIPPLVQIMAWRRTGDEPLSEPMMTQFNDAYTRHSASMTSMTSMSDRCHDGPTVWLS